MGESPRWSRTTKYLVSAALVILVGLVLYSFRTILAPLVIAALVAYIFAPVIGWLSKLLHIPRIWAVALAYLVVLGLVAMTPALTMPAVGAQVAALWSDLTTIANQVIAWLQLPHEVEIWNYTFSLPALEIPTISFELDRVINLLGGTISPIAGGAFSFVLTLASGVGWVIFVAVLSFYLLVDAERIGPAFLRLAPPHYREEMAKLVAQMNRTWSAFLRGQLALSVVIGFLTGAAMGAVGLRFSIALGVVAGVLEILPSIGPFIAAIPAVLIALFQGATNLPLSNLGAAIVVAAIYIFIQSVENNFLVPRIIGSSLNLPPLAVIVGVLAGATAAGILGALLAAPVLATFRDILRYIYRKLWDLDPFPEPPTFADMVQDRDIRAVLFDLDGTLLESDETIVQEIAGRLQSVPFLARLYDGERLARRLVMALETPLNLIVTVADLLGLDNALLSMRDWLREAYGRREPAHYVPVDGVVSFIQESSQRFDLAIVTTRNRKDTAAFIHQFGLGGCFKSVVTHEDVKRLKPHPEPVVRAAKELGYSPQQCIVVGDTTVDIRAGKKAGTLTIGVLCGFGERPELDRLDPDLILDTTPDLAKHLPRVRQPRYENW